MARASLIQTNFTSGELSPRIAMGRMDVAKYGNGLKRLENCVVTIQGGAYRRPGTRFIGEIKGSGIGRLVSFVYSRNQAYILLMGAGYMWMYKNRARIGAFEVATPYTVDQLGAISYVQKSDTAFFAHASVYPQRLQRFGDASWKLANTPFITEPFSEVGTTPAIALTLNSLAVGAAVATAASAVFLAADVGRQFVSGSGVAAITGVTSATVAALNITSSFDALALPANSWTLTGSPNATITPSAAGIPDAVISLGLSVAGWRADDVGKYVSLNSGLVKITAYNSPTSVTGVVLTEVTTAVAAPPSAWELQANSWNAVRGFPRAVTINKQRLYFANTFAYPQTVWGSIIRGYLSFQIGVADDDAFAFELDGASNSPIVHLAPSRKMLVLTESDEMSLTGGQDKAITPTNIDKNDESSAGCSPVRPIKVGNELLFCSADGLKVHAMGYRYDIDGFPAPDRTVFAEHITATGLREFSFEKKDSTLYAVRNDGVMAVCAYDIDQEVIGWGRWLTQGNWESVSTIPTATAEDTYVIVSRKIGGVTKRYLEVFDRDVLLDSCVVGSDPAGKTVWSGLAHLEGKTVHVRGDGAYMGEHTVTAGAVTLSQAARNVQIGLGYKAVIELLQPELGSQGTTAQGNPVSVASVIIRVLDTQAAVVNGTPVEFRKFDTNVLDLPPPTVEGDFATMTLSDEIYKTQQLIEQPYPAPFHVLDVIRKVTIND
ncbi:hypothetical protein [Herbaspirillum autotrophicum]|uniref:hypothetical protein n=1 Tax=Herbaspirillum autotrophicum TaxID=180195 RepID=UPI00067A8874|nr:hypothetical protein [Herbaspirillum autotrophicum]